MSPPYLDTAALDEVARCLRNGRLSAGAIADWAIANHARRGTEFHAYKTWDEALLRRQAAAADAAFAAHIDLGPLQGIAISVKDIIGVAGYPTFAGCPRQLPEKWQAEGPVVQALRHQLAVISGKAHSVQFAYGGMGRNPHWGAPVNPWDAADHRAPGGSSSGAGVSLWEGSALLAIGTDTAGSVRIPASMTGTVGIRPTAGRWSTAGIVPLASTLDTAGVLARTAGDLAIGFGAIDPQITEDGLAFAARLGAATLADFRVGIEDWFFADCDPGVAEGVRAALDELAAAGLRLESASLPHLDAVDEISHQGGLHVGEFTAFINNEMVDYRDDLDPTVAIRFAAMADMTAGEHVARLRRQERLAAAANAGFGACDAIVGPTLPLTPPKMADVDVPEPHLVANFRAIQNTHPVSLLAMCAISVPVALDAADMPVGMQIVCPGGADETAIALAMAIERVLGPARERLGVPPRRAA